MPKKSCLLQAGCNLTDQVSQLGWVVEIIPAGIDHKELRRVAAVDPTANEPLQLKEILDASDLQRPPSRFIPLLDHFQRGGQIDNQIGWRKKRAHQRIKTAAQSQLSLS